MATTIVTKYGSDAPEASDIVRGELAVDTENGRLYTENAAGAVVEIGLKPEANVDVTGTITASGVVTANAGVVVDNITIDGTTLTSTDDFIVDASSDINLDASGGQVRLKGSGSTFVTFNVDATPEVLLTGGPSFIGTTTSDAALTIFGSDGGSNVNALVFDMSAAGAATFNAGATFNGSVSVSPDTAGKNTFQLTTNASNDARLLMRSNTTTKVDIQANGDSYFNGGKVGIGLTNPSAFIHVTGSESSQYSGSFNNTSSQGWGLLVKGGADGDDYSLRVQNKDATDLLVVKSNGNVGIGDTSPSSISGSVSTLSLNGTDSGTSGGLAYKVNGTIKGYHYVSSDFLLHQAVSGVGHRFLANNTEAMRIVSSGRVGINTSSPVSSLHVSGNITIDSSSNAPYLDFVENGDTGDSKARIAMDQVSGTAGEMLFYTEGSGTLSQRMKIDSSGNVGIGTNSPSQKLDVKGSIEINSESTASSGDIDKIIFRKAHTTGAQYGIYNMGEIRSFTENGYAGGLDFYTGKSVGSGAYASTFAMRIDSSGRVGIGSTSPSSTFRTSINGDGSSIIGGVEFRNAASGGSTFTIGHSSATSPSATLNVVDAANLIFQTSNTERMRIDSSGNLLVGKTAEGTATDGIELNKNDVVVVTRNGDAPLILNRRTSDGDIAVFRKDNATVGSIGTDGGSLAIGGGDVGIGFYQSADALVPYNGVTALRDDAIDLGQSNARFDDIYATNGTIQTSDRNEKQDIAELSEAEQRVAVACKGLLRKFRWKSSVAEKGDEARTHFGIIAQDLQAAFAAEGLDAGDYAMFISTTWTDEETNEERTRMGVRYSELLAFIISAI